MRLGQKNGGAREGGTRSANAWIHHCIVSMRKIFQLSAVVDCTHSQSYQELDRCHRISQHSVVMTRENPCSFGRRFAAHFPKLMLVTVSGYDHHSYFQQNLYQQTIIYTHGVLCFTLPIHAVD